MNDVKSELPKLTDITLPKIFQVDGYFKPANSDCDYFKGSLIYEELDLDDGDTFVDEDIFFFGLDERAIKSLIQLGDSSGEDFTITSYEVYRA
jgi:hypothetical protein